MPARSRKVQWCRVVLPRGQAHDHSKQRPYSGRIRPKMTSTVNESCYNLSGGIHIGAVNNQQRTQFWVPIVGGEMQRCKAILSLDYHVKSQRYPEADTRLSRRAWQPNLGIGRPPPDRRLNTHPGMPAFRSFTPLKCAFVLDDRRLRAR